MSRLRVRLARLELDRLARYVPEPWQPPTPEAMAAFLAPMLAAYADCGLLDGPALDEASILAQCEEMSWPATTAEPASVQGYRLLQAVLARCGMGEGSTA